jgi:hypothetical protein
MIGGTARAEVSAEKHVRLKGSSSARLASSPASWAVEHCAPLGRSLTSSCLVATPIPMNRPVVVMRLPRGPTSLIRARGPGNCPGCPGVRPRRSLLSRGVLTEDRGRSIAPSGSSRQDAQLTETRLEGPSPMIYPVGRASSDWSVARRR